MEAKKGGEYKKGLWTLEEDRILMDYIRVHGKGKWNRVAKMTDLKRCGKSCRLRWMNYLSPNVKRGDFSAEEDDLIIRLHNLLGNRWSLIAGRVPGRTDNQVKNHWNTHLSKKLGVKKGRCKTKSSAPSTNTPSSLHFVPPSNGNDASTNQGLSGDVVGITSSQGLMMRDCCENSFLFFNDYQNLYTPCTMEIQDESLDFFYWHGL